MIEPAKRIDIEKHHAAHASHQTTGGRWQRSLVSGAIFGNALGLIRRCLSVGILDPGIRIHGPSAVTFWYKDASRRSWIMPSDEDTYSEIARKLNLEEVVDTHYGPYLRFNLSYGQARVLLPDPEIPPEFVVVTEQDLGRQVSVATLDELTTYYAKRRDVQKSMYAKISRPYKRITK